MVKMNIALVLFTAACTWLHDVGINEAEELLKQVGTY